MAMEVAQHNWKDMAEETTVEEAALVGRQARRTTTNDADDGVVNEGDLCSTSSSSDDSSSTSSSDDEKDSNRNESKNNVCFDKNGGIEDLAANLKTIDFQKVLNNVVSDAAAGNVNGEIISGVCLPPSLGRDSQDETDKLGFDSGVCLPPSLGHDSQSSSSARKETETKTIVEEEVVELQFFDRAVNKLHTHDAYCPNCNSHITKVVLRRVKRQTTITTVESGDDLVGCLSCFSIFIRIGKKLNPFPIFASGEGTNIAQTAREPHLSNANQEGCFDLRWFFHKREEYIASEQKPAGNITDASSEVTDGKPLTPGKDLNQANSSKGPTQSGSIFDLDGEGGFLPGFKPPKKTPSGDAGKPGGDEYRLDVVDTGASSSTENSGRTQVRNSKSVEIVKSIVYGGLIESITSLGVVSSAAASDASTMNIVTIGVANLIAGFFVICQNLMDLKYNIGGSSTVNDQADQYRELLGQRKHFLLHATFALFSYLAFGLVSPVVYGFTFRETDDKDYKLIAVGVASLLCIIILAIAKAYTLGANKLSKYLTTVMSYATAAAMASGVGYATGHLIQRVMDQLGWFDIKPAPSLFSMETNSHPAWASY